MLKLNKKVTPTKEAKSRVPVVLSKGLSEDFDQYLTDNNIGPRKRSEEMSKGLNKFLGRSYWLDLILERSTDTTSTSSVTIYLMLKQSDAELINQKIDEWNAFREDPESTWPNTDPEKPKPVEPWERVIELKQADFIRTAIMALCYPELTALNR